MKAAGNVVKLHQRQTAFVVEYEDGMIAIDEPVAAGIHEWAVSERDRRAKPNDRRRIHRESRRGFTNHNSQ